jgi:hypothetical protein
MYKILNGMVLPGISVHTSWNYNEQVATSDNSESFTVNMLHGAEYYLKSLLLLLTSSKISRFLTEPEGSPCSQKPATGPYPEPAVSSSPHRSLSPQGSS